MAEMLILNLLVIVNECLNYLRLLLYNVTILSTAIKNENKRKNNFVVLAL